MFVTSIKNNYKLIKNIGSKLITIQTKWSIFFMSTKKIILSIFLATSSFTAFSMFHMDIMQDAKKDLCAFEELEIQTDLWRSLAQIESCYVDNVDYSTKQVQPSQYSSWQNNPSSPKPLGAPTVAETTMDRQDDREEEDLVAQPYVCPDCIGVIAQFITEDEKDRQEIFNNFKLTSKICYLQLYQHRIKNITIKNRAFENDKPYSKKLNFSYLLKKFERTVWLEKEDNTIRFSTWKYPYENFSNRNRTKALSTIEKIKEKIAKHNTDHSAAIAKRNREAVQRFVKESPDKMKDGCMCCIACSDTRIKYCCLPTKYLCSGLSKLIDGCFTLFDKATDNCEKNSCCQTTGKIFCIPFDCLYNLLDKASDYCEENSCCKTTGKIVCMPLDCLYNLFDKATDIDCCEKNACCKRINKIICIPFDCLYEIINCNIECCFGDLPDQD